MRILHTSDLHLGSRLHGIDRTDELFSQFENICEIASQQKVDVLLVAGDVFEKRGIALPELTKKLADILAPRIREGMHVILVPGNHDDREHFNMMNALLSLEQGYSEKVHIVKTKEILKIQNTQFVAIPYPLHEMLQPYMAEFSGSTERNVSLSSAFAGLIRSVIDNVDPALPAILIAHIYVAGTTTPNNYELTYDNDIRLGKADLPILNNLKYIALGHIHQFQKIDHPIPCYYCGSMDRLNWGEKDEDKYVNVVDVFDNGDAKVTSLPLGTTPFHFIQTTASQLENLRSMYHDLNQAFVTLEITNDTGVDPATIYRIAKDICPRQISINIVGENEKVQKPKLSMQPRGYAETSQKYLEEFFKDDPDLPELQRLTSELLNEVENATTAN
ncbi:MAG TPA: exonuclease SbcCD subunit D [Anaerolineales bacterium]|nr:exonuclease SbcCD subunit D [Anaerolineales bacterium]